MNNELLNQLSDAVEFLDEFQSITYSMETKEDKIKDLNLAINNKKRLWTNLKPKQIPAQACLQLQKP